MAKKNKTIGLIIILAVIALLIFMATPKGTGLPDGIEYGDVKNGECVGRSGVTLTVCCGVWNEAKGASDWVPCEDLRADAPSQQAIVTIGSNYYENLDELAFGVKVQNTGKINLDAYISKVDTVLVSGGDLTGVNEINDAWTAVTGSSRVKRINSAAYQQWGMSTTNPISLSIPTFKIKDGVYRSTVYVIGTDPVTGDSETQTQQIEFTVEQRKLGFSVSIALL